MDRSGLGPRIIAMLKNNFSRWIIFKLMATVNISIKSDAFNTGKPLAGIDPKNFTLQIGPVSSFMIPTIATRRNITRYEGGVYQVVLRQDESFTMDEDVFKAIKNNFSTGGGTSSFMLNLLNSVVRGLLEVRVDTGSPLSPSAIMAL